MKSYVINLFAGPGAGKSSTAYMLTGLLKFQNIDAELATEFAKDMVWRNTTEILKNQSYVFAKQYERLWKLNGKVKFIVTDSPLLLSLYYQTNEPESFRQYVLDKFNEFNNINFFIIRKKPYNENGRLQTEDEAKNIDHTIKSFLLKYGISFKEIEGTVDGVNKILQYLSEKTESDTVISEIV